MEGLHEIWREWRARVGYGDVRETGLVTKKKKGNKSTTGIGASLTPDFNDTEEGSNTMGTSLSLT